MSKMFIHWYIYVASSGSTVVEKLSHQPKFEDMTPASARAINGENGNKIVVM
jgi:hypothetical protein